MSGLKKFLDRRAEGIEKENTEKVDLDLSAKKNTETRVKLDHDLGYVEYDQEVEEIEETPNLTDDEFWDISNQFNLEVRKSNEDHSIILQAILENYTPLKIQQFGERYKELNS